ncbi:MAG: hypothetical protein ACLP8A_05265 [Methylovirgula sp.]
MQICLFTVMHAGNQPYFADLVQSLNRQNDPDFELVVFNDTPSWRGQSAPASLMAQATFPWRWIDVAGSIVEIRKIGLRTLCSEQRSDALIFIDSDDVMAPNRVEFCRTHLKSGEILATELILFGDGREPTPWLTRYYSGHHEIQLDDIIHSNCLGLSNTAVFVADIVSQFEDIPNDIIAFDWALFSMLLHFGCKSRFLSGTSTYYRQHADNIASPLASTDEQILRSVLVKAKHYRYLAKLESRFAKLRDDFDRLLTKLGDDEIYRRAFCSHMRATTPPSPRWWENARMWDG